MRTTPYSPARRQSSAVARMTTSPILWPVSLLIARFVARFATPCLDEAQRNGAPCPPASWRNTSEIKHTAFFVPAQTDCSGTTVSPAGEMRLANGRNLRSENRQCCGNLSAGKVHCATERTAKNPALSCDDVLRARREGTEKGSLHAIQDCPRHRATLLGRYYDRQHLWSEHG
jgi:hypothetical protein